MDEIVMFKHAVNELVELNVETKNGKRHYITPSGIRYPSVTTITSQVSAKGIAEWRRRVGEKEANKIASKAGRRGTRVHKLCEDYVNNTDINFSKITPSDHFLFKQIKPILDTYLGEVYSVEGCLYSDYLRTAGRVDCVGVFDGKASIIDFKTANKRKQRSWINNYFMQESAYAVMYEERTSIPIGQLVTIIAVEQDEPQLFVERRDDHIMEFIKYRDQYEEQHKCLPG